MEELEWSDISYEKTTYDKKDYHHGKNGFYLDQDFFVKKYNPYKKLYVITYEDCSDIIGRHEHLYHCTNMFETVIKDILEISPQKLQTDFCNVTIHMCDRRGYSQGRLYISFVDRLKLLELNKKDIKIYAKNKYYRKKATKLLTDIIVVGKLIA